MLGIDKTDSVALSQSDSNNNGLNDGNNEDDDAFNPPDVDSNSNGDESEADSIGSNARASNAMNNDDQAQSEQEQDEDLPETDHEPEQEQDPEPQPEPESEPEPERESDSEPEPEPQAEPPLPAAPPKRSLANSSKRKQAAPKKRKQTNALVEIIRLQQRTELLIPKAPFQRYVIALTRLIRFAPLKFIDHFIFRLVREVILEQNPSNDALRITEQALSALHEASEAYVVQFFEDANAATMHRQRVTLHPKDFKLVQYLRRHN